MKSLFHLWVWLCALTTLLSSLECIILETGAAALITALGIHFRCKVQECCIDEHIPYDIANLRHELKEKLFGQPLAQRVATILEGHKAAMGKRDHNALAISLHGWPGTGKNYVANMIARSMFSHPNSKFVKMYSGMHSFPEYESLGYQKMRLQREISDLVSKCGRALIIFDEVNDMPSGLLDVLKPMLDFHHEYEGVSYRDTVFLFLSNLNGNEITDHFISLKKPRDSVELADFEPLIRNGAFQEIGGMQNCRLLFSHLIDHFIPFLPLEQVHVEKCIIEEFKMWGVYDVKQKYIDAALSVITYGPGSDPIYSNAGCKRVRGEVAYLIKHFNLDYQLQKPPAKSYKNMWGLF